MESQPAQLPVSDLAPTIPGDFTAAVRLCLPPMMGLLPMGLAFGVAVAQSPLAWWWAPVFSTVIFAGSLEFILLGLVVAAAPLATIALTAFLVNFRHVFYALSFPMRRVHGVGAKIYSTQWWDGSRWEFPLGNVVDGVERDARKAELGRLQSEIETAKVALRNLQETVEATPTDNLPAALGLREYKTIADNSESVMSEIKSLRTQAKAVLRSKSAMSGFPATITSADGFSFEMSKKFMAKIGPLLLGIMNLQVEIEATRRIGSFWEGKRRLNKTWDKLNEVAKQFGGYLDYKYFSLREEELALLEVHRNSVLREKEEERERRAELREELKVQQELEAKSV